MITAETLGDELWGLPVQPSPADAAYRSVMVHVARRRRRGRVLVAAGVALAIGSTAGLTIALSGGDDSRMTQLPSSGQSTAARESKLAGSIAAPLDLQTYPVGSGSIGNRRWQVAAGNFTDYDDRTCLLAQDDVFDRTAICFAAPEAGSGATWSVVDALKPGVDATGVFGVAPPTLEGSEVSAARVVMSDGLAVIVEVHSTPASREWAYFAAAVPGAHLQVSSVQLLGDGNLRLGQRQSRPAPNELPCQDSAGNSMPCPIDESVGTPVPSDVKGPALATLIERQWEHRTGR